METKVSRRNDTTHVAPAAANIQCKLTVGSVNDPMEAQADAVADQVMRMPANGLIQRKCSHCEEEEKAQRKPLTSFIQKKEASGNVSTASDAVSNKIQATKGNGAPLDPSTKTFMESRFGIDFSNVNIHTDSQAVALSSELNAQAFAVGNDVYFNSGKYSPESSQGKHLLAHELTHVLQQRHAEKLVQRRLVVDPNDFVPLPSGFSGPPTPLPIAVQGLINETCPDGNFVVDTNTGVVSLGNSDFCEPWHPPMLPDVKRFNNTATPVGCECLCNVINHSNTVTINFTAGGPFEQPDSIPNSTNGSGSNTTVNVDPRFQGQYRINGRWVDLPFFLLFSHELCGHALSSMRGTHARPGTTPPRGTPPDERHAVDVERAIAAEHNLPRRPEDYAGAARERP